MMIEGRLNTENMAPASDKYKAMYRGIGKRIIVKDPGAGADQYHEVYLLDEFDLAYLDRTLEVPHKAR